MIFEKVGARAFACPLPLQLREWGGRAAFVCVTREHVWMAG